MRIDHAARVLCWIVLVAALGAATGHVHGQDRPSRVVVLDTTGYWRLHHALRPPVIALDDGRPITINGWLDRPTPAPAQGWRDVGFDDSAWLRGPARINAGTPYVAQLALRARFTVDDPDAVEDLRFTAVYHGGIVVYVNGREVARRHMPDGEIDATTLAEPYPREAFVDDEGGLLVEWDGSNRTSGDEDLRRLALRERAIEDVSIPAELLESGVNVLAIELHRAPYDAAVEELKLDDPGRRGSAYNLAFNTCEILHMQLSGASPEGLSREATRPRGLQVWNSDMLASDFDLDFAGPSERLYPLRIVGPRGGIVSGKVVVGSRQPIEGLAASLELPIGATRIRYGLVWGSEAGVWGPRYTYHDMNYSRYPRRPARFGALTERAPAVVPVREVEPSASSDLATPAQPEPVFGAVVPVWVTVDVPRDAPAGVHRAELRIEADGEAPLTVPVELVVADWTLPELEARATWAELIQVPDTTAVEYDLPLWSEAHWRMIARSFELIGETSSRVVHLPLICHTNHGTAESMVRWQRQPDGSWTHDLSILERYLDTAIEHMGRPELVVLQAWEIYQLHPERRRASSQNNQEERALEHIRSTTGGEGSGPVVTTVDRSGEVGTAALPHFDEPEGQALWADVFDKVLALLEERGLSEAAALGSLSDAWPNEAEVRALDELTGGLPWVSYSHMGVRDWRVYDIADVRYQATVTQNGYANDDPPLGSHHGWAGSSWPRNRGVPVAERLTHPGIFAENPRGGRGFDEWPASRLRHVGEFNITGDQRGIGRVGVDYWPAIRGRGGQRQARVAARYPQSSWRNQDLASSLLAPGPEGPVATPGFEAFREGLQESEARAVIEQALLDEAWRASLGEELVARCEAALVERTQLMLKSLGQMRLTGPPHWYVTVRYTYWHRAAGPIGHQWFLSSGWQHRSQSLFELAGEVARQSPYAPGDGPFDDSLRARSIQR
ncbi:MAG: glycoside hydrolase domain-containing protein [Phycisphaeraceae bacterium]